MDLPSFKTLELPKLTYRLSCTQHFGRHICVRHVSPWYRTWILLGHAGKKIYVGDMARTRPWTRQKKKKKKKGIRLEEREGRILATRQRRTHIVVVLLLTSIVLSLSPSVCVWQASLFWVFWLTLFIYFCNSGGQLFASDFFFFFLFIYLFKILFLLDLKIHIIHEIKNEYMKNII